MRLDLSENKIELHLSSDTEMPRLFGKAVRDIGGHYTECRGYSSTRFVTVPNSEDGRSLALDLIARFPEHRKTTVIARTSGPSRNASEDVHYVPNNAPDGGAAVLARIDGLMYGWRMAAAIDAYDQKQKEEAARPGKLRAERERLVARIAEIDIELAGGGRAGNGPVWWTP